MYAKINWKPNNTDLRKFGIAMIIGFGIIGGLFFWRGHVDVAKWLWIGSAAVGGLALVLPPLVTPIYFIWMAIAFVMGTLISFLIVALIYYFIITPVGLLMRVLKRDALRLKKESFKESTYWQTHDDMSDKKSYERLF